MGMVVNLPPSIESIMGYMERKNKYWLDNFRRELEGGVPEFMPYIAGMDKHLYAVLKPTREENLMRIENILRALPPEQQFGVRERSKKLFGL